MEPQNHYILQRRHTGRKLEMQNIYNERADDRNRKWRFHKGNKNMQWQQISQCNKKKHKRREETLSLETKEWEAGVDEWRRWIKVGWRWKVRQVTIGKFWEPQPHNWSFGRCAKKKYPFCPGQTHAWDMYVICRLPSSSVHRFLKVIQKPLVDIT